MRRMPIASLALLATTVAAQGIPGNDHSYGVGASPDGRYVVFTSLATNLVAGDTNGQPDVFVFDRQTSAVLRASVDSRGLQANGISEGGAVSADGRYIAFASTADNLPPGPGGPWLKDLSTGAIERLDTLTQLLQTQYPVVSDDGDVVAWDARDRLRIRVRSTATTFDVPATPAPPDAFRDWGPALSGDGRYLAFATKLDGLVAGDTNGQADVLRYDRIGASYAMVSSGIGGAPANGPSGGSDLSTAYRRIAISRNGSRLAFYSEATNLEPDSVALGGLYFRDMAQPTARKIARCFDAPCQLDFYAVAISGDGQWISFFSPDTFVEPVTETPRPQGYYRYFVADGQLTFVANNEPGAVTVALAFASSSVSDGAGQVVAQSNRVFAGIADNGPFADVLLFGGAMPTLASRAARGTLPDGSSRQPALSADGRRVAFASYATNLGPADANRDRDVYVRDLGTGAITLASTAADGTPGDRESRNPALSQDGRYVAFISGATNLTADDANGVSPDVFLKDLTTGAIERISRNPAGAGGGGVFVAAGPAVSADARYVAFTSAADDLVAGDFSSVDVYLRDTQTDTTIKANPTFDGLPPDEFCSPCDGHKLALSDDGRYLAFQSRAANQIAGLDTSEVEPDVFVFDRTNGQIELVSRAAGIGGVEGDCRSSAPSLSGDGRYVAFWSCASNLAPGFVGPAVYLRDRTLLTTIRVARSPEVIGLPGTEPGPQVSGDGTSIALVSFARGLVAGDTNQLPDVFVWTRATARLERASLSAAWTQADGASYTYDVVEGVPRFFGLSIARDGARIAVSAAAQNLVADDRNAADDVFVFERVNQAVLRASAAAVTTTDDDRTAPAASSDARYAVSVRTDRDGALGGGGARVAAKGVIGNKFSAIARYDWLTSQEMPIDVSTGGLPANGNSRYPSVSGSGRYVVFASDATNLGAPDLNGATDVFVRDTVAGTTTSLTTGANGESGRSATSITGNKFRSAFETNATNLGPGADTNGVQDVLVATEGEANAVVSVSTGGAAANGPSGEPAISSDGRLVGFTSLGDNLVPADTNGAADVFLRDLVNATTVLVSVATDGGEPNGASGAAQIVATGAGANDWVAAYESEASNIVANDFNTDTDVFVRTGAGTSEIVSIGLAGTPANGKSSGAALSPDGRYVTFVSTASNLVPGDTNNAADVFLRDRVAGTTVRISVSSANGEADDFALRAALGLDLGGAPLVVFDSAAANLVAGDVDEAFDLFRRTALGATEIADTDVVFRNGFE